MYSEDLQKLIDVGMAENEARKASERQRDENNRARQYADIQLAIKDVLGAFAPVILEHASRFDKESEYSTTTYLKYDNLLIQNGQGYGKGPAIRICEDDQYHDFETAHDYVEFAQALVDLAKASDRRQAAAAREAEREAAQLARHPYHHIESELKRLLWDIQQGRELNDAQNLVCAQVALLSEYASTQLPQWEPDEETEAEDG